ncbi:MAG: radical SAM protein [Defluviitaleaceae bacterium]|nr:radical SAM protein [Defluviitaleaceae bacterium]
MDFNSFKQVLSFFEHSKTFMFGTFEINRHIIKLLLLNDIKPDGYIAKDHFEKILIESHYDYKFDFPIYAIDELDDLEEARIGTHTNNCDNVLLEKIKNKNADKILFIEENFYDCCYRTFQPRNRNSFVLEIDVADHCNLNCNNCWHFSQIAEPTFLDPDEFNRDMKRMSELSGGLIHKMYLLGGEPLLHPKFDEIIAIARNYFPQTFIQIISNGILLPSAENAVYGNLYELCKKHDICISITEYPVNLDINKIKQLALKYEVSFFNKLEHEENIIKNDQQKLMQKAIFDMNKSQNPSFSALNCYFAGNCFTLKNGKLATCPIILNIKHFNKAFNTNLEITEDDYIDIHKASNFFELAEFMAKPASFCGYCDFNNRPWEKWKPSSKTIDEYLDS